MLSFLYIACYISIFIFSTGFLIEIFQDTQKMQYQYLKWKYYFSTCSLTFILCCLIYWYVNNVYFIYDLQKEKESMSLILKD